MIPVRPLEQVGDRCESCGGRRDGPGGTLCLGCALRLVVYGIWRDRAETAEPRNRS